MLLTQHNGANLSGTVLVGPWNAARYSLEGSGRAGIGGTASHSFFWIERGPNRERRREMLILTSDLTAAGGDLNGRMTMRLQEGEELTRLEFALQDVRLVSRTVRQSIF